ncbi:cytochrome P450 [Ganoderma sinense ZZ0214-1]|uniref:Cytochrome P450 n=1 Tax=Ganoderma sinense ZZ0214-1 TaxID=1077348 RepID=A0A2G8S883_9APHY|nr:cytochrome P450 [Ganoderma sinense ZZ0214-1]
MDAGQYTSVPYVLFTALVAHQILRRFETHLLSFNIPVLLVPPALLTAFSVHYDTLSNWITSTLAAYPRTLALYLAFLGTVIVGYRISPFHPLAQHPGPFLCKVSAFWMAYLSLEGEQHRYIRSLHERHGDVVRIGPNLLSVRKPSATAGLLGLTGAPKGPHQMGRVLSDTRITMIGIQDTDVHLLRRRAWARGFTPTALKAYEDRIARRVSQLVARLEEQKGEFLLNQWFNAFSYDLMSDMAFGGGTNLLEGKDDDGFWPGLKKTATTATFFGHVPWFGILLGRIPWVFLGNKAFLATCRNNAARRLARGTQTPDLFHYLSHEDIQGAGKNEPRPSMDQIVNDGILTMVAGSDTTSGTLTGLFACLLSNPDAYRKLQAEVDRFYPPGETITTKHHKEMHYLNAVLNETLRLFPAVPAGTQRQVQRNGEGITVDSLYVPPGTIFWMHVYSFHRDPRNFSPSPNAFLPERWLVGSGAETGYDVAPMAGYVHNEAAFIPFSHGPMNCVGKALALQQLKTAVCALMQRFAMRPREGWTLADYERNVKDYFVTVRGPLPASLEVRGGKSE